MKILLHSPLQHRTIGAHERVTAWTPETGDQRERPDRPEVMLARKCSVCANSACIGRESGQTKSICFSVVNGNVFVEDADLSVSYEEIDDFADIAWEGRTEVYHRPLWYAASLLRMWHKIR